MDFLNYLAQQYGNGSFSGGLGGLDLRGWLSSLGGAPLTMMAPNPMAGYNPMAAYPSFPSVATGTRLPSPTYYPTGSQMLTPGGTPETSTPVGGQPAAPSYWDTGPQGYPTPKLNNMNNSGILQFPQQWLAALSGIGQSAAQSATEAALQRAAAYHAALLNS